MRSRSIVRNPIVVTCLLLGASLGVLGPRTQAQQLGEPTILALDQINMVNYNEDTFDITRFATLSAITPTTLQPTLTNALGLADITTVNGVPARGLHIYRFTKVDSATTLTVGRSLADVTRLSWISHVWEIMTADGVSIGTIMAQGMAAGVPPPGSHAAVQSANLAIVGGTGAYAGIRGVVGNAAPLVAGAARQASVREDPAYRRVNGGGNARFIFTIYPGDAPQVVSITHADSNPVTDRNPAVAGETLTVVASGLGPTSPSVSPGQAFPASPQLRVNAPVAVLVNGRPAQVSTVIGLPGAVNRYLLYFQVPAGTTRGLTSVQLTSAWLGGPGALVWVN